MKKVAIILLVCVAVVVAVVFGGLVHAGLFYKPAVVETESGSYTMAYLEHTGDYSKVGKMQMDIYNDLIGSFGATTEKGIGIYFDDPAAVAKDKLRSEIGCILEGENLKKAELIKSRYKVRTLEKKMSLMAEHPFTSPLSIFLGIMKVYPLFGGYLKGKAGTSYTYSVEIYDMPGKKIIYLMR